MYFQFHALVPLDKENLNFSAELGRSKSINAADRMSYSEGTDSIAYT